MYKPTPISSLENENYCNDAAITKATTSFPTSLYRPTPINELDRYSPSVISSLYSPSTGANWSHNVDLPTYSPVVPHPSQLASSATESLSSPNYPFYHPSPAYPPSIDRSSSISEKATLIDTSSRNATDAPDDDFTVPKLPLKRSKLNIEIESDAELEEKRKKILSLYHDLYSDDKNDLEAVKKDVPTTSRSVSKSSDCQFRAKMPNANADTKTPLQEITSRPRKPLRESNKIPMPIRIRYLEHFIEACLRISSSESQAYAHALTEEQACHDRAANRLVYLNAVIGSLKALKTTSALPSTAHDVGRKTDTKVIKKKDRSEEIKSVDADLDELVRGHTFYEELTKFILTEDELISNGFPRPDLSSSSSSGRAVISIPDSKKSAKDFCSSDSHFCCRCAKVYRVNKFGEPLVNEHCTYHWGKTINVRVLGVGRDMRYTCCQAEVGQQGCQICPNGHVFDTNKWYDLNGYVSLLPALPSSSTDSSRPINVYALDCEMVYTTGGCELARITVVDVNHHAVLDRIIKPYNTVIDPNTRFSGLKISDLEAATTRITDVQMELLHLFDEDTILIGHSLESDLTALKIIHSKVVDTSVVFPHRSGPPLKRALRNIAGEVLQQIIQQDESGHDSKEDALVCMKLMQHRVKEILRKKTRVSTKLSLPSSAI